jgi:hypothetical protein
VQTLFSTTNRAQTTAAVIDVQRMGSMSAIFDSMMASVAISGLNVVNNQMPELWTGVASRGLSDVSVTNSTFRDNAGSEHLFLASTGSQINVDSIEVADSLGSLNIVRDLKNLHRQ